MAIITLKDIFDAIRGVYNNEANKVQLSGRSIEEITIVDAVAITTTDLYTSTSIDITKYKSIIYVAQSTLDNTSHDVNLQIFPQYSANNILMYDGSAWATAATTRLTIDKDAQYRLNEFWPIMLNNPPHGKADTSSCMIRICAQATNAPTSGSLSVRGWGVPN